LYRALLKLLQVLLCFLAFTRKLRFFCDKNLPGTVSMPIDMNQPKEDFTYIELDENQKLKIFSKDETLSYEIDDNIKGAIDIKQGVYMISFTCTSDGCETRQSKTLTKNSYHNGVV